MKNEPTAPAGPGVLIIRTSALGDIVQALPVLTALRRHGPSWRIGWLVEDVFAPLLDGHPDLDEVIPVRLRTWRRRPLAPDTWRELGQFFSRLDRFAPEVALDLMGNHKSGVLAALTLSDRRIGFDRTYRREPSSAIWTSETVRPSSRHSVDKMLAVLEALEVPAEPVDFGGSRLPALAAEDDRHDGIAPVLIHPGAGWDNKRYPPARWGEVAALIHERTGAACGVVIARGEEDLTRQVIVASGGTATAVEATDLSSLTRLLHRASLVLGSDTGPLHLAHALGRPVLCLMGPTDPETCGPYGAPETAVWRRLPCSFCHKRYPQPMPCLEKIPPEVVAERARQVLAGLSLPPAGPCEEGEAGCLVVH